MLINNANAKSADKFKVAIVAIAKDESAYLAEWVHHHLYFGFDGIYIGLNRVIDNSYEVAKKIQSKSKSVHVFNVDWIDKGCSLDKNSQMQSVSYSYLTDIILNDIEDSYTHILYLDIDEFWFPRNFDISIKDYLDSCPEFDAISFSWLEQSGDDKNFTSPFGNLSVKPSRSVKSLITSNLCENITQYRCHFPKVEAKQPIHLDANGDAFICGDHKGIAKKPPKKQMEAYVLHRMYRSECEYLALLRRERPGVELPIKDNRSGFKGSDGQQLLDLSPVKLRNYWKSLDLSIKEYGLDPLIEASRRNIIKRANTILDVNPVLLVTHADIYKRVLDGTYMKDRLIEKLENSNKLLKEINPDDITPIDLAALADVYNKAWEGTSKQSQIIQQLELNQSTLILNKNGPIFHRCATYYLKKKSYDQAFRYIRLAKLCRPKGPHIQRIYLEIEDILNKQTKLSKFMSRF